MKKYLFPAIRLTILSLILLSGVYTLILLGIGKLMPGQGKGEIITYNGQSYYANIGQKFTDDKYFWSRPSAVEYNASGSGGSNKGPNNPELLQSVKARLDTFLAHNPGVSKSGVPVDLITASGSGLDPNISLQAAKIQVKRIAKVRGIAEGNIEQLILSHTEKPLLGVFGPEKVNVLKLNIALDNLK